jgi:hypothetical protein
MMSLWQETGLLYVSAEWLRFSTKLCVFCILINISFLIFQVYSPPLIP